MRTPILQYYIVKLFHNKSKILNNILTHYIKHTCQNGGDILEIGFGGGTTANMIQDYNIKTHTIIERDDYFFKKLGRWAYNKPNVKIIHGDWVKDIPKDKKYDGIFIDLWNDTEDSSRRKILCDLLDHHTKPGTVFLCATKKVFDKHLYLEKGHKYEEIKTPTPKLKWYNLLSHLINTHSKDKYNAIFRHTDLIPKVTYKI